MKIIERELHINAININSTKALYTIKLFGIPVYISKRNCKYKDCTLELDRPYPNTQVSIQYIANASIG